MEWKFYFTEIGFLSTSDDEDDKDEHGGNKSDEDKHHENESDELSKRYAKETISLHMHHFCRSVRNYVNLSSLMLITEFVDHSTKRMSIEIGPSSFASRKKKSKKSSTWTIFLLPSNPTISRLLGHAQTPPLAISGMLHLSLVPTFPPLASAYLITFVLSSSVMVLLFS